jgi:histidinol-phosphate aminotransferase
MKYARKSLEGIEPYVPGEQPKARAVIKLNTNENPYPPSPRVLDAVQSVSTEMLRKYPDPIAEGLRAACARQYGYPGIEWVTAGNGMDELLLLAVRAFVEPGEAVLSPYPSYLLYDTMARFHGARSIPLELGKEFELPDAFFSTAGRLCFLARPNAPTGLCCSLEEVERLCAGFNGVVVLDEAYVDFADDNCMDFPKRFENVVVMRTFSKSYSLAGARLGIAVGQPPLITELMKVKDSYNVNAATQAAGIAAIEDQAHMWHNVSRIRQSRARLTEELIQFGFEVLPSQANFVFAIWNGRPPARAIFDGLRNEGIYVRYFEAPRMDNALRITVGTDPQIEALVEALGRIIGRGAAEP